MYWRLTLTVTAGSNSTRPGQQYVETDWLAVDGTVLSTSSDGFVPVALIDPGPGADERARAAVTTALQGFEGMPGADFFACFPRKSGSADGSISTDPNRATHYSSIPVTCTTGIEAAPDRHAWILTLEARWAAAPDRKAGAIVERIEVDAAGGIVEQELSGDPLPGPLPNDATPVPSAP